MSDTKALGSFDTNEQEVIRQALKRYMLEHKIGAPALCNRIIDADKPRYREINQRTLQRFIRGEFETANDLLVTLMHNFAKDLPYYSEESELAFFGASVFNFLHPRVDAERLERIRSQLAEAFTGKFVIVEEPAQPEEYGGTLRTPFSLPGAHNMGGTISFMDAGEQAYLRAFEQRRPVHPASGSPRRRNTSEGVMIGVGPRTYVFLRDCLTRIPKSYVLMSGTDIDENLQSVEALYGDSFGADTGVVEDHVPYSYRHRWVKLVSRGSDEVTMGAFGRG